MMAEMDLKKYETLLRNYFPAFIQRSFLHLNPNADYHNNWHIEVIAAALEDCRTGTETRLITAIPPRNLKSHIASIAFPAWYLGHDPTGRIICISYGQDLADKFARDCRSVMSSSWYRRIFPTRLQRQSVDEIATTREGYRLAVSVGGPLTGKGADLIIIDDPLKPEEAISEVRRKAVNEWYKNTLYSRLNDKQRGCIIIIMQRLHEEDLVGYVLRQEPFRVLALQAIAEHEEEYKISTLLGSRRFTRKAGEALHPGREPLEVLERIRQLIGEYHFAGQYQQSPAPFGGGMVKEEWFKVYDSRELPEKFEQIVQSWDTANKKGELNDYSVCTTWGVKSRRFYLLHVLRKRLEYPALKRAVREQAEAHRATVILIEDRASGTQLAQDLIADGVHCVKRYKPEGDKVMRLDAQTATIENGFVYIPRQASWLPEYLHELTTFPNGKYKDQADSTSQALDWLKRNSNSGFMDYIRKDTARGMFANGSTESQIAAHFGISLEEVREWLKNSAAKPVDIFDGLWR
jgi:predicted phage terminase large subunit-like protein